MPFNFGELQELVTQIWKQKLVNSQDLRANFINCEIVMIRYFHQNTYLQIDNDKDLDEFYRKTEQR